MLALALTLVLGGVLAALVSILMLRRLPADQDEVWFLVVVKRMARGQRLYSEVFYGAGPIPVWWALAVTRGGRHGLRRLRAAGVALTVLATVELLLILALTSGSVWLVTAAGAALAGSVLPRRPENHYGALAKVAALGAVVPLALTDTGLSGVPGHALAAASGLALACATFAKHPVGAATAVAVLPGWWAVAGASAAYVAAAAFMGGSALVVAGLALRHELRGFVRRTLTDKRAYLSTGRLTFSAQAGALVRQRPPGWWRDLVSYSLVAAAPIAALSVLVTRSPAAPVVVALTAASVVGVFPRADPGHVRPCAPPALIALLVALEPVPLLALGTAGVLAIGGALDVGLSLRREPVLHAEVPVPALDGLATLSPVTSEALQAGREVRRAAGRRVLVLRTDAAQWYLALGLRNPTAYDYPLASTFGSRGQQVVAERLRRGDVEWCLFVPADAGALTPTVLEEAVRTRMEPVLDTVLGELYRARS